MVLVVKRRLDLAVCMLMFCLLSGIAFAQNDLDPNRPVDLPNWLVTDPVMQNLPVFNTTKNLAGNKFELKELLAFENIKIDDLQPSQDDVLPWSPEKKLKWAKAALDPNDNISWDALDSESPQIVYLAGYINTDRWIKTTLKFHSSHFLRIYLDGKKITEKTDSNETKDGVPKPGKASKEVSLTTGTHLIVIKSLKDPDNDAPWNIKATLQLSKDFEESNFKQTAGSEYYVDYKHVTDVPKVTGVSISPDADFASVSIRRQVNDKKNETWIELYDLKNDSLYRTYRGGTKISSIRWAPVGRKFTYTQSDNGKKTLWLVNLDDNSAKALLENVENLSGHTWASDGTFIVYNITQKRDKSKDTGLKLLKGMEDRQPKYRDRSFLYKLNVNAGTSQRLTSGLYSTSLHGISNKGDRLIFGVTKPNYSERPYSKTDMYILDLNTLEIAELWSSNWSGSVQWSPDDRKLLVTAGPEMFDAIGRNVPEGTITNNYDKQAFIYNLQTKEVEPITKNFDPKISQALWHKSNYIYFKVTDKAAVNIYEYDPKTKKFKKIESGVESVLRLAIAKNKPVAAFSGSSATVPTKAYVMDLKKAKRRTLTYPGEKDFTNVSFGDVHRWNFINE